ncbi:hypothetical protein L1987_18979 [Smallanthus sonchifolius]|uniref:Uncharacterized protein n=1 Tax=Smallanthus sonchifolius TaxID=185202 RepID=A0ACB9J1T7_9ASTR|nr:hypothetical protein L1987_18979 [Smallanthus sonchifolius]
MYGTHEKTDQARYYDVQVFNIQRKSRDIRGCRCISVIRYEHDNSEIMKIIQQKSVRGLSVVAFEMEVIGYTIALAYCLHKGLPISAYGELAFLLIQDIVCFRHPSMQSFSLPGSRRFGRTLKFRISATIADDIGTANITIFDRIAKQLIKKEASDLVLEEDYTDPHMIPRYGRPIFTVSKISELTNTTDPVSSTLPDEPTSEKPQLTPAPETPAAKPPDASSTKRLLFETKEESSVENHTYL